MKTEKLVIMGAKRGEFTVLEVPATVVDIGSEFETFVHRDAQQYDMTKTKVQRKYHNTWAVSEKSTGTIVATGNTRKMAIENATKKVAEVGRDNMRLAVERQQNYLKANNVLV